MIEHIISKKVIKLTCFLHTLAHSFWKYFVLKNQVHNDHSVFSMYKQTFALLESVLEFSSSSTQPAKNVLKNSLILTLIDFLGAISYSFF